MKKEIVGIFVCMMLIITTVPIVSSLDRIVEKNDNNELIMDDDCVYGNLNGIGYRFGIMNEGSIHRHPGETSMKPSVIDTPDYFNWMDSEGQDWTTPAKSQSWPKECGCCAIFSAISALESIISIKEGRADLNMDLSEQYVLSCLSRAGNCIGGNPYSAFYYIMSNKSSGNNCNGIIPEFCFPYQADDDIPCSDKCPDWEDYLIPIYDFGKWYPDGSSEDIDAIKSQIMQYGPVATSMLTTHYNYGEDNFIDWGFINNDPEDYYSSSQQFDTINHCVAIVGWKDNPEIPNGGYWICKNSWSTDWGYNGFFNIEYNSLRIDDSEIDWVVYNPDVYVNWRPVPDAGGIYYGDVGQEIIFDASGSFDHEGEIISYDWDFGDGNHGSGITATHTYESQEVYPVMLTVIDDEGNIVNDTTWAFIGRSNDPPNTPTIDGPLNGKKGVEYEYNFSAIDPDGDDIYYFIYWGDMFPEWIGPFPSGEKITLNHTWISKAKYHLIVKAKDTYGFKSDFATFNVTMPKSKPSNFNINIIAWLFERFSNAFPIITQLLKLALEDYFENLLL